MTARPVDLARVRVARARLDKLAAEHPEAFRDVGRMVAALRCEGLTGRAAAAAVAVLLDEIARERPGIATPEARETWERTLAAIETFDE